MQLLLVETCYCVMSFPIFALIWSSAERAVIKSYAVSTVEGKQDRFVAFLVPLEVPAPLPEDGPSTSASAAGSSRCDSKARVGPLRVAGGMPYDGTAPV